MDTVMQPSVDTCLAHYSQRQALIITIYDNPLTGCSHKPVMKRDRNENDSCVRMIRPADNSRKTGSTMDGTNLRGSRLNSVLCIKCIIAPPPHLPLFFFYEKKYLIRTYSSSLFFLSACLSPSLSLHLAENCRKISRTRCIKVSGTSADNFLFLTFGILILVRSQRTAFAVTIKRSFRGRAGRGRFYSPNSGEHGGFPRNKQN